MSPWIKVQSNLVHTRVSASFQIAMNSHTILSTAQYYFLTADSLINNFLLFLNCLLRQKFFQNYHLCKFCLAEPLNKRDSLANMYVLSFCRQCLAGLTEYFFLFSADGTVLVVEFEWQNHETYSKVKSIHDEESCHVQTILRKKVHFYL